MRILFLAPQPFFQERGTPIAVRMAVETLSQDDQFQVDLLTYHEGQSVEIPGVRQVRMWVPELLVRTWLKNIPPGPSFKKIVADCFFSLTYFSLMFRRRGDYQLVHAVEEAGILARIGWMLFRMPYVYDMDSQLALQLSDAWRWCRPLGTFLEFFERAVIRRAVGVIAVCDTLADYARAAGAEEVHVVTDVSLLPEAEVSPERRKELRNELGIGGEEQLILYVGNLEPYQGIELLIEAFEICAAANKTARLVVVGGNQTQLKKFQQQITSIGLGARATFVGPRPLSELPDLLAASDVLVSPRLTGNNTPMKIYSYLHAGKPLVATRLPTHTQVLTDEVAFLCAPSGKALAEELKRAIESRAVAQGRAHDARMLAENKFTRRSFQVALLSAYRLLAGKVKGSHSPSALSEPA